jgi:hypothetical protein
MARPWSDSRGDEGFELLDLLTTHLEKAISEGLDDRESEEWVRAVFRLGELLPAPLKTQADHP